MSFFQHPDVGAESVTEASANRSVARARPRAGVGIVELRFNDTRHPTVAETNVVVATVLRAARRHKGKSKFNPVRRSVEYWRVGGSLPDKLIANVRGNLELFYVDSPR